MGWLLLGVSAGLSVVAVASPLPLPVVDLLSANEVVPLAKAAVFVLLFGSVRSFDQRSSLLDSR